MQRTPPLIGRALAVVALVCVPAGAQIAPPLPLDAQPQAPLGPPGLIRAEPELFGNYTQIWALADGTQVIQYYGDFTLQLDQRRLRSQDAVVWMQKCRWQDAPYYHFEVFLAEQAQVRDSAGTVTSGPVLFVTFNTLGPARVHDDVHTAEPSADTPLYQEADRVRQAFRQVADTGAPPEGMTVHQAGAARAKPRPVARPIVRFRAREPLVIDERAGIITATGDVYVSQGLVDSGDFLEMRTDAAVVFLAKPEKAPDQGELTTFPAGQPAAEPAAPKLEPFPPEPSKQPGGGKEGSSFGLGEGFEARVAGVYLQGDVVLTRGERMIRAAELYYDFENDRALILDAVMRAMVPDRQMPIYVRAEQVRQLSTTQYVARQAMISTSEFHTPHLHIGASQVFLTDATPRDQAGRITGLQAGQYRIHDATLNLEGVPIAYWPYAAGDFRRGETLIRNVRMAYSDDFGATFQSKWYLFNLLGLEDPQGVDALLRLDYFSKRGPGVGIDVDYERENSYGLFRGYYIHDTGEDNLGPFRETEPDTQNRGRITWRHRQFLPQGWELTLEGSYLSDPTFMEEYFKGEFEEGKEQETLAYLKKQKNNWAFTALAQWRVLDFLTQTEHLPDLGFHWIGEPLGSFASFYHESHLGFVRYKPDDRRLFNERRFIDNTEGTDITFRGDTRNEIDFPIKIAPLNLNIVPFAMGRAGYWDSSVAAGSTGRMFGSAGVRAGSQFWRLFENVRSDLLDLDGVRHVIRPEVVAWASSTNRDSIELHPFDAGIENIDDFYGASLALRQRWQTKRGGPGVEGASGEQRKVDWIVFDVELNLFGNTPENEPRIGRFYPYRPESSLARNHVRADFAYRISDTTAVLSDANFDLDDGNADQFNLSYAVERSPRFAYFIGYRRIHDTDSNLIGGGLNYEINSKYRLALRGYYDLERNRTETLDLTIVRKFPRWYAAVTFELDKIEDNFSIGLSVWPEGAPQATLGSRRYTGLATSTGIRPED